MCGPVHGILGVEPDVVINKFLTQLPGRFAVAKGPAFLNGVAITLKNGGTAEEIVRLHFKNFS